MKRIFSWGITIGLTILGWGFVSQARAFPLQKAFFESGSGSMTIQLVDGRFGFRGHQGGFDRFGHGRFRSFGTERFSTGRNPFFKHNQHRHHFFNDDFRFRNGFRSGFRQGFREGLREGFRFDGFDGRFRSRGTFDRFDRFDCD